MRIGDLSQRTGVPARLLRYYEEQGLLQPARGKNGYRAYHEDAVDRVVQIRGLIDAGVPTAIIRDLLPCMRAPRQIHADVVTDEMLARLEDVEQRLSARIECLARNRDAVASYIAHTREAPRIPAAGNQADR